MRDNPILYFSMIGASITRLLSVLFSTYLILWIQSFSDHSKESREIGKTIYLQIMVISTIISAFVFPFVGQVCDLFSPRKTIPFAFIFRALTTGMFYCVDKPNSYLAYFSAIMMIVGTIVENISIDTIFAKNLPKETRGILNGVYSFSG
jgi:MFS family permease